ncbi:hypothetical protein [Arthrobacter sp. HLT1-21]
MPEDPFLPHHAGLPDPRPDGSTIADDRWADMVVGGVDEGPLTRGLVSAQRREAFRAWSSFAEEKGATDSRYNDFALGLRTGVSALYERRMPYYSPVFPSDRFNGFETPTYISDSAVTIAGKSRTSGTDREHWRLTLQHAQSPEQWRGHLAAGVILSGQDEYWGMRDDPDATVTAQSALI